MLIPHVVAQNSETNPSGPFYVYAKPGSSEIVTITHLEFGRASHRAANILRRNGEGEGPASQVVALIALSDTVLYHATLVGLMTANFVPFPISPRNSAAGIFQLLRDSSCHRIIATCITLGPLLAGIKKHIAEFDPEFVLTIEEIPSLGQIYPNLGAETSNFPFQPYSKQISRASLDDIGLYMHSSGSTGLPKTIAQTHRALMQWSTLPAIAEARDYIGEKPMANMALPPFHQFGIICQLLQPLFGICVAVYPPIATSPSALPIFPSPDNILDHARQTKCIALTAVPALLAAWLHSPPSMAYLKTLKVVGWSGGPLPQRSGDALVDAGINLRNFYGGTEFGPISTLIPREGDEKEWAWFRVSDVVKVRWAPQGDDTFECQILTWENYQPTVENLDDVRGYATSDLFVNHPEKKHLWKPVGRIDDVIVHTSGEKTVPAPMEDIVTSSPYVAGAVMFGTERVQAGILIETISSLQIDVQNASQLAELRNKIWPVIEDANEIAPAFSRIFKETILFASPDKHLPLTGKGTVMRKAALILYAAEIESIYATVEEQTNVVDSIQPPTVWEVTAIQEWLLELAATLCNSTTMSATVDLRHQGFDSLTATIFRIRITKNLRSSKDAALARAANAIPQNLIYAHPTISQLSVYLHHLVGGTEGDMATPEIKLVPNVSAADHDSLSSLEENIVEICSGPGIPLILFPGSTGRLGPLLALRAHFAGTLWGVQVTQSTPTTPFAVHAAFFVEKIRQKQPNGPYRLATYSGSSVVGVAVAKLLEDSGQPVLQLSFIDGFPLLWNHEATELLLREEDLTTSVDRNVRYIIDMFREDDLYGPGSDQIKQLEAAFAGSPHAAESALVIVARIRDLTTPLLQFLADFYPKNTSRSHSDFIDLFTRWVSSVKAPLSVVIAEFGMVTTVPIASRGLWADLGAHQCPVPVRQCRIPGVGHVGILAEKATAAFLQQY